MYQERVRFVDGKMEKESEDQGERRRTKFLGFWALSLSHV